jgi:uncharacterized protein (DUF2236 family)
MHDIVRRRASDVRLFGAAGYALTLQVAHPTIAAGVREHSTFTDDPWARFFRTADYLSLLIYGPQDETAELGDRLREIHRTIRGIDPTTGRAYSALEPSAYAWVHATLAEAIVRGHRCFGEPLTDSEKEQFWSEWRRLGAELGIRDGDLPETWPAFQDYLFAMIADVLEHNDVVDEVFATANRAIGGAPWPWFDDRLWAVLGWPLGRYGRFIAVGTMPSALRRKLGLSWSNRDRAVFEIVAAAHRSAVLPPVLRHSGPMLLRMRQREVARGPFGLVRT